MSTALHFDESLAQRLPLPVARLYRRAHNAKDALNRHLTAFSLWEAGLKLLASVAVVEYARRGRPDSQLAEVLHNLARPSLGHWWDFTRRLMPILGDAGDPGFQSLRKLLLGKTRDDLPRLAGLDAALLEALGSGPSQARSTVRLTELFDRLVRYRNTVLLGHAAPGQLPESFHERMAPALLAGTAELFAKLDVLAGRRLLYVGDIRQAGGVWLIERFLLTGESPQRIATLELPRSEASRLPDGQRLYLDGPAEGSTLCALYPLLLYDTEAEDVLFLNARRGKTRTEYLCYTSGRIAERPDLGSEQRELLARALGLPVSEEQAASWAAQSQAEEPPSGGRQPPEIAESRRTLGEFELLSELGSGGMGVVYRAWQPSLGRQVALKKLLHGGDTRTEARFRREIKALGHVEHPHLIKVFTSGSDGEDWFYVMELIEGAPLADVCARLESSGASASAVDLKTWQEAVSTVCQEARRAEKPLSGNVVVQTPGLDGAGQRSTSEQPSTTGGQEQVPASPLAGRGYVRQVAELLRQVSDAAHALHEKGVIHRDIKPGNILVTANGNQAVLMDLGLAQLADDEEGRLTRTRQFVGTLRYASPQQVLAVGKLDRRSDVYSLGATLWELLALKPIYGATEQTPTPELMEKIQREEPERLRKVHPGISRDLEAVVFKCLEKDPNRRYATAAELAEDLGRYLDGKPVSARRVSGLERGWKWARRRPALAALGAVIVLATAGLLAGWISFTLQLQEARNKAEASAAMEKKHSAQEKKLRQKAERAATAEKKAREAETVQRKQAEEVSKLLGSVFRKLDPRAEQKGLSLRDQLVAELDRVAAKLDKEFVGQPLVRARLREALGQAQNGLGEADKAVVLFKKALAERQARLPPDDPATLTSMNDLAVAYWLAGQREKAVTLCEEALAKRKDKLGPYHPDTLTSMNYLGYAYFSDGHFAKALPLLQEALVKRTVSLGPDHPDTLKSMNDLGMAFFAAGQLAKALPLFQETVAKRTATLGPDHPDTLASLNNLAEAYWSAGQRGKARALLEETLAKINAKLGPVHPSTLRIRNNLAEMYLATGQLGRALSLIQDTWAKTRAKLGPSHPHTLASTNDLAEAYQIAGELDKALALFQKTLAKMKEQLGPNHPDTLLCMDNLARTCLAAKEPAKALPLFRSFLAGEKKRLGSDDPQLANIQAVVALDLLQAGQPAAAEPILRECLAIREKKLPNSWLRYGAMSALGSALLGQKKYQEAEPLLLKGYEGLKQRQAQLPASARPRLTEALQRLVQLYDTTGQKEQAARWRKELETTTAPKTSTPK
jgi:serine/threonine protein kinase